MTRSAHPPATRPAARRPRRARGPAGVLGVGLLAATLAGSGQAAAGATPPPAAACVPAEGDAAGHLDHVGQTATARLGGPTRDGVHGVHDQVPVAVADAVERALDARVPVVATSVAGRSTLLARTAGPGDDLTVRVPVHAHVVDGSDRDARGPGRRGVRRQLQVLNTAFAGDQAPGATVAPFRFHLASYERVVRPQWHRAEPDSRAEHRMRRTLHRGAPDELDLFFSRPRAATGDVALGSAVFPWEAERRPRDDGVVVHTGGMPSGTVKGYARGDSAVHEVGHWLGLFHTFEGGCGRRGDRIDDTPREASPSFRCESGRDTCRARGKDSVRNFMNYSLDACMDRFTPDQVDRMTRVWLAFRAS